MSVRGPDNVGSAVQNGSNIVTMLAVVGQRCCVRFHGVLEKIGNSR